MARRVTVLRVPYHLDEYLPGLDLPVAPAPAGPAPTITAELPAGGPWARLTVLYRAGVADLDPAAMPDGPLYVHLDLDVIDPAFLPGLLNATPGGVAPGDVAGALGRLAATGRVAAVGIACTWRPGQDDAARIAPYLTDVLANL